MLDQTLFNLGYDFKLEETEKSETEESYRSSHPNDDDTQTQVQISRRTLSGRRGMSIGGVQLPPVRNTLAILMRACLSIGAGRYLALIISQGCLSGRLVMNPVQELVNRDVANIVNVLLECVMRPTTNTQAIGSIPKSIMSSTPIDGYHSNYGPAHNANGILTFALQIFLTLLRTTLPQLAFSRR